MKLIDLNQDTIFENAYDCRFHSKTLLRYHIIFSTKYRYRCLNPIRDTMFNAFRDSRKQIGFRNINDGNRQGTHSYLSVFSSDLFYKPSRQALKANDDKLHI